MARNNFTGRNVIPPQVEEREKLKMEVTPLPFKGDSKAKMVKALDLIHNINEMFRSVSKGFKGSSINIANNGTIEIYIAFTEDQSSFDETDQRVKVIDTIENNRGTDSKLSRLNNINIRTSNVHYALTLDGKDIIEEFVPRNFINNGGRVNWKPLVFEQVSSVQFGKQIVEVVVGPLDLNSILKKLYGNKATDEEGKEYRVVYNAYLTVESNNSNYYYNNMQNNIINSYINVIQLNIENVHELERLTGKQQMPTVGNRVNIFNV